MGLTEGPPGTGAGAGVGPTDGLPVGVDGFWTHGKEEHSNQMYISSDFSDKARVKHF